MQNGPRTTRRAAPLRLRCDVGATGRYLLRGWKVFFRAGVTLLRVLSPQLLRLDVEGISCLMQSSKGGDCYEVGCPAEGPRADPEVQVEAVLQKRSFPNASRR